MIFYKQERIGLFIDGSNLHTSARALGIDIDYKRLLKKFSEMGVLVRALYYTALTDDQEYSPLRPLVDWLDYNGYTMVTKPVKEFVDNAGRRRIKGNMDVEIAIDIMEMAENLDHVVLFSGDGDFRRLIEAIQSKGTRATVVSTARTSPPMIADELRRQSDNFIDLQDLASDISRLVDGETSAQPVIDVQKEGYQELPYAGGNITPFPAPSIDDVETTSLIEDFESEDAIKEEEASK